MQEQDNSLWLNQANDESLNVFNAQTPDIKVQPKPNKKFLRTFSKLSDFKLVGAPMVISVLVIGVAVTFAATAPFLNSQLNALFPKDESSAASLTPTPDVSSAPPKTTITPATIANGDIDDNGSVNVFDLGLFASFYDETPSNTSTDAFRAADYDGNKKIDVYDLGRFAASYPIGKITPSASPTVRSSFFGSSTVTPTKKP